jgi:hypothetical protein
MTKVIGIFLPVFFSALVICAVVLCACGVCQRPAFLTFGSSRNPESDAEEGSSATYSESEVTEKRRRHRHSKHGRVVRRERVSRVARWEDERVVVANAVLLRRMLATPGPRMPRR